MYHSNRSIMPYGLGRRDPWNAYFDRPLRLFDQHFGGGLLDEDLLPVMTTAPFVFPSHRPQRLHSRQQSGLSQVELSKDKFEVKLDVQQFSPEEVTVKTVDNVLVVEGKHEEKQDEHGYISRHFTRKYLLPDFVKPENVVCNLSSDGVLTLTAPTAIENQPESKEKVLPINMTGKPALTTTTTGSGQKQEVARGDTEKMATE